MYKDANKLLQNAIERLKSALHEEWCFMTGDGGWKGGDKEGQGWRGEGEGGRELQMKIHLKLSKISAKNIKHLKVWPL
jgi:hypothetical protein